MQNHQQEIRSEFALHVAVDYICKNLNRADLGKASQVCKTWYEATKREIARRGYIQRLLIPHNFDFYTDVNALFRTPDELRVHPHVAILFSESLMREREMAQTGRVSSLENDILQVYKKQFPGKLIGLEVGECLTEVDPLFESPAVQKSLALERSVAGRMVGLLLPLHRQTRMRVAWCIGRNGLVHEIAERMVEQLAFEVPRGGKSTLLMLTHSLKGYFIAEQVMRIVRQRFLESEETIWGGIFGNELVATSRDDRRAKSIRKSFVGIRLSGPSLDSWTLVLDCSAKRLEVDRQLAEFAARIRRKRCTLGLFYGPRRTQQCRRLAKTVYGSGHELAGAIRRALAGVPVIGLLDRDCRVLFDHDATCDESSRRLDRHVRMSLIVLAYD